MKTKQSDQIRARMYGGGSRISPTPAQLGIAHRAEQRGEKGESQSSSEGSGPAVTAEPLRVPQKSPESGSEKWKYSPSSYEGEGREMPGLFFWPGTPEQRVQQLIIFLSVLGYCRCPPRLPQ